ncbi:MAG: virulence RhuM family protein [Candidatus Delongbacteria bacterium]|nr:virulence RhuM family protein [Candidatus Delongbacteria bacterium]
MNTSQDIIIYQSGEVELKVAVRNQTIWLRQNEISKLLEKDRSVITRHINNILKDREVDKISNVQKMHFANSDKPVKLYSLDVILAVGYGTNSAKAIKFRQWSTKVLKDYILNGYAINGDRITHQRFKELEYEVKHLQDKVNDLSESINSNEVILNQDIFFEGQVFDAHKFVSDLFSSVKKSIVIIDNYIDVSILAYLSQLPKNTKVKIITKSISRKLNLDIEKFEKQHFPIEIKIFKQSHDRFVIIDDKDVYHIGASLKDLGKKWFAFSKMDKTALDILNKIEEI